MFCWDVVPFVDQGVVEGRSGMKMVFDGEAVERMERRMSVIREMKFIVAIVSGSEI